MERPRAGEKGAKPEDRAQLATSRTHGFGLWGRRRSRDRWWRWRYVLRVHDSDGKTDGQTAGTNGFEVRVGRGAPETSNDFGQQARVLAIFDAIDFPIVRHVDDDGHASTRFLERQGAL
ncbi:hypothetical protein [Pendulispora albinea]|uniref:Uncharacterized protein n=1 Tax=Pendulispora albinea TaxID=2741071 RepID=A0ABZ2MA23_9BACT